MGLNLDRAGFFPDYMIEQMVTEKMIRTESDKPIDIKNNVQASTFQPTISDKVGSFVLQKGESEIVPLNESLWLPMGVTPVHDTRSTYGKVEVAAELTDQDGSPINRGYQGELFAKIKPHSFNVRVHPGLALNQTRFMHGELGECTIPASELAANKDHVRSDDKHKNEIMLGIYLKNWQETVSGYVSVDTDEVLDLAGGNPKDSFFRDIAGTLTFTAEDRLYLYWTKEELAFRDDVEEPFVCEMLRMNPTGEVQVCGAGLIEYGSWSPPSRKAMEIRPPKGYIFNNGGRMCIIKCYSMLGTPEGSYGPTNGNMNLTRLLPSIIID